MDIIPNKKSFFDLLSSKQAFALGCVATVLVSGTIGCLVLGSYVWKGTGGPSSTTVAAANTAAAVNTAAAAGTASGSLTSAVSGTLAPVTAADHVTGSGDVSLVIYSDFQCPYCKSFDTSIQQVIKEYSTKVKVVFRNFPLSFHENAMDAAEAAECAGEQGKFWEYAEKLFVNQTTLGEDLYKSIASEVGLNVGTFDTCRSSDKMLTAIQEDQTTASAAGVRGTPASFVIGKDGVAEQVKGGAVPFATLKTLLDQKLVK